MKRVILVTLLFLPLGALAIVPLTTDDADPVDLGQVQINSGWQFSRAGGVDLNGYYFNPIMGITHRSEFGLNLGYQWRDGAPEADGITDLTLESKWRLLDQADDPFRLTARFDAKIPTASPAVGLGTGKVDADAFLIGTYTHTNTSLDWDIGYTKINVANAGFGNDQWFLGQAIRQQLNNTWTLVGETYVIFPQGSRGAPANFYFDGGCQYNLSTNLLFSVLGGSAAGHNAPVFTANCGFTWNF